MRVLLATDGSSSSEQAAALVAQTPWPSGTAIRIVHVIDGGEDAFIAAPGVVVSEETIERIETAAAEQNQQIVADAAARQARPGLVVDTALLRGRPASAILSAADSFAADLIVVGSHGRGTWASRLLGSVTAEIVEYAARPVLVARGSTIRRIVLADDGSPSAARARELVGRMPGFKGLAVRVVSVSDRSPSWFGGFAPGGAEEIQALEDAARAEGRRHADLAEGAAQELGAMGLEAGSTAPVGDPGSEIVRVAVDWQADLIVMGTRGQTGLARLLLGSVARKVIQHAHTSVLVVRG
jgi:nucleotide-binding universal stress UspA family protein